VTAVLARGGGERTGAVIGETAGNLLRIAVGGEMVIDQSVDDAERVWAFGDRRLFREACGLKHVRQIQG